MEMTIVAWGLLIPFIGTSAGAACVFFLKKDLKADVQRALTGFAAGIVYGGGVALNQLSSNTDHGKIGVRV